MDTGDPYELVIAIVNLPGPTLLTLADLVGRGAVVANGPWPDDQLWFSSVATEEDDFALATEAATDDAFLPGAGVIVDEATRVDEATGVDKATGVDEDTGVVEDEGTTSVVSSLVPADRVIVTYTGGAVEVTITLWSALVIVTTLSPRAA